MYVYMLAIIYTYTYILNLYKKIRLIEGCSSLYMQEGEANKVYKI